MKTKMAPNHFTLFGATGTIGREVLPLFSKAGISCHAITRDLKKAEPNFAVTWLQGDFEDQGKLPRLLAGCSSLFLVSGVTDRMVETQCHLIDVARATGVEHIVRISSPGAAKDARFKAPQQHGAVDDYLRASGLAWNILQPQAFMQNWLGEFASTVRTERRIYESAGDGRKPFTDVRDIAAVAFSLLTDPKDHLNKTLPLSGGKAWSYYDVAAAIGAAIGEPVTYIALTPEEAKARFEERGFPAWAVQMLLGISAGQRAGAAESMVATTTTDILGKTPRSIDDFARDYSAAFR